MGDVQPDEAGGLLRIGQRRKVARGQPLFLEGDPATFVAVVTTGSFRITSTSRLGVDSLLALAGPGELIGEMAAFEPEPRVRAASATAFDTAEALLIPCDRFLDYLGSHGPVAIVILKHLGRRMRSSNEVRTQLSGDPVSVRVARRLLSLCADHSAIGSGPSNSVTVPVPVSHTELAAWVGASRETVSRSIRDLRDAGLLTTSRRAIEIIDLAGLERHAR